MKIFAHKEGRVVGPYTKDQIFIELKAKRLNRNDQICLDGKNWVTIKDSGVENNSRNSVPFMKFGIVCLFIIPLLSILSFFLVFYYDDFFSEIDNSDSPVFRKLDCFDWESHPDGSFKYGASIVLYSKGGVRVQAPGSTELTEIKNGQIIQQGSSVETTKDGETVLLFSNGTSMSVGKKTNFSIGAFGQQEFESVDQSLGSIENEVSPSRLKLNLDMGELVVVVKKLEKDSSLTITSKLGVAGVRGTSFSINARSDSTSVNVLSGAVDFIDSRNNSSIVGSGKAVLADGSELILQKEILKSDLSRILLMEKAAISAAEDISVFQLREYFDRMNPDLGSCDPVEKNKRFLASGGGEEIQKSIEEGLDWLVSVQSEDGSWGKNDKDRDGNLKATNTIAMTGMAVLCFLQHCEFDSLSKENSALKKGIQYLKTVPISKVKSQTASYAHPIYARALVMAFEKMKLPELEDIIIKTISMIVNGQNENGGWAYSYGKGATAHVDLSVTGWNLMALIKAKSIGIEVPGLPEAITKAIEYVKKCQDNTGKFAYKMGTNGKPSLTGMGAFCLQLGSKEYTKSVEKGLEWIIENISPTWNSINFYALRHTSRACFYSRTFLRENKYWDIFKSTYPKLLIENQNENGSWPPAEHFHGDSEIFRSTLALDVLLTFYQY